MSPNVSAPSNRHVSNDDFAADDANGNGRLVGHDSDWRASARAVTLRPMMGWVEEQSVAERMAAAKPPQAVVCELHSFVSHGGPS